MSMLKQILLFFILPIVAVLMYPPRVLSGGLVVILVVAAFFAFIGFMVFRGRSLALTFLIFLQGMNVIVRLMMVWSNSVNSKGEADPMFTIFGLLGLALSLYLLLRLDQSDIRVNMIS